MVYTNFSYKLHLLFKIIKLIGEKFNLRLKLRPLINDKNGEFLLKAFDLYQEIIDELHVLNNSALIKIFETV